MVYDHCYTCHFKRKMSSLWLDFHYLLQRKLSTWSLYQNCRIPLSIYYNNFSIFLLCKIYLPSITTPTNSKFFLQKYVFWPYRLYDVWHRHLLGSGWYPTWKILSMVPCIRESMFCLFDKFGIPLGKCLYSIEKYLPGCFDHSVSMVTGLDERVKTSLGKQQFL